MVIGLIGLLLISGCGSSEKASTFSESTDSSPAMEAPMMEKAEATREEEIFFDEDSTSSDYALTNTGTSAPGDDGGSQEQANPDYERKIIKTGFVYMETLTFDETIAAVKRMVNMYNGYTSYSESNGGSLYEDSYNTRYAHYTIKVPAEMFEEMYEGLHTIGNVLNSNEGKEDVTSQFVDIEARLTTLKVQEERLLAILERSETLEDIIELEYALQDTRYEIESYTTNLRNLADRVRYSTLEVNIQEVYEVTVVDKPVITFSDKISEGLKETFKEINDGAQNLVIFIVTQFPYIIFTFVVIGFGRWIYKRLAKKDKLSDASRSQVNTENEDKE